MLRDTFLILKRDVGNEQLGSLENTLSRHYVLLAEGYSYTTFESLASAKSVLQSSTRAAAALWALGHSQGKSHHENQRGTLQ